MSPENINERVAAMEPQLEDLKADVDSLYNFKETMIKEITELTASVKALGWKVSLFTGVVMVTLDQVAQWGFKKLLP